MLGETLEEVKAPETAAEGDEPATAAPQTQVNPEITSILDSGGDATRNVLNRLSQLGNTEAQQFVTTAIRKLYPELEETISPTQAINGGYLSSDQKQELLQLMRTELESKGLSVLNTEADLLAKYDSFKREEQKNSALEASVSEPEEYIELAGNRVFQLAPPEIRQIVESDPRLSYASVAEWWSKFMKVMMQKADPEEPDADLGMIAGSSPEAFRDDFARHIIIEEIKKEFPDTQLLIRGGATFVDTNQDLLLPDGQHLYNPLNIIKHGQERSGITPQTTTVVEDDANTYNSTHQVLNNQTLNWLVLHPQNQRNTLTNLGRESEAKKIFPILMFYKNNGKGKQPELIRAVVFDYPEVPISERNFG